MKKAEIIIATLFSIRRRNIFKKDSYKGISKMRIVGAVVVRLALSITTIGLLFKFQTIDIATVGGNNKTTCKLET